MMDPMESCSNNNSDRLMCVSPELQQIGTNAMSNLLPEKSSRLYEKQYEFFALWCKDKNINMFAENAFLMYFNDKAKVVKSSTLWSTYSMLKSTFTIKHNVDISKFSNLLLFLKQKNVGYKPKTTSIFTRGDLIKFLLEAPDPNYLMIKVCFIFGIVGACRMDELKKITIHDVEDKEDILLITILDSKTGQRRRFAITNDLSENLHPVDIYRKYRSLRPSHTPHKSLFIFYRLGRCSTQPVGIHTFGKIPSLVATYLKLPDSNNYTGHAFRRTSASLFTASGSGVPTLRPRRNKCATANVVQDLLDTSITKMNDSRSRVMEGTSNCVSTGNSHPYNNYCHTCMGPLAIPRNIRASHYNNLLQILHCILGFEITEEKFNICEACEGKLNSILEFKNVCLKTIQDFANCLYIIPKEERIDIDESAFDNSTFDFEIKKSHLKNCSLDIDIDKIPSKHLESRTSLESNSSNNYHLTKYEQTATNSHFGQQYIDRPVQSSLIQLSQFPKPDVLQEISRYRNLLNKDEHKTCRLCSYVGKTFEALCWHMTSRHKTLSKSWCSQCNLVTDNVLKHKETSQCSDFICKFCNEFRGYINESIEHLRSHNHEIQSSDETNQDVRDIKVEKTADEVENIQSFFIKDEPRDDSSEEETLSAYESEKDIYDDQTASIQEASIEMDKFSHEMENM